MAILVVWASPNEDGLTASAKDHVVKGIKATGGEAEILHLNKCNLKSCLTCGNGWGKCQADGQCVIPDDFSAIYNKLIAADGIVWITPVYWHDLSECLKYFLDRLRRCETAHNHYLQGKACLLIACAGGTGRGAIQCLHNLEATLNHMGMVAVDRLPVIQFNRDYMLTALAGAGQSFTTYLQKNI
jgi:multimeric flavodoxin WrbA